MIVFLQGVIFSLTESAADLDVHGVGYRVFISENLVSQLNKGDEVFLFTYHHLREDTSELYGFLSEKERAWFELLLGVSGVGPRGALQIVSATSLDEFVTAVEVEDVAGLCELPGVGKKTAQRIILELKDKLKPLIPAGPNQNRSLVGVQNRGVTRTLAAEVVEALQALGYNEKQAEQAAASALSESSTPLSIEDAIRRSLQWLSPMRREL